jgi:hypothetical protein
MKLKLLDWVFIGVLSSTGPLPGAFLAGYGLNNLGVVWLTWSVFGGGMFLWAIWCWEKEK